MAGHGGREARVSTFYPAKCMRMCTLDYGQPSSGSTDDGVYGAFESLVVDVSDKGQGADLYMAGKSTATNGPSSFNVQMSDSYYYSC